MSRVSLPIVIHNIFMSQLLFTQLTMNALVYNFSSLSIRALFGESVVANAVHGSSTADKAQEAIQTFIGELPEGEEEEGEEGRGDEGAGEGADDSKREDEVVEEKGAIIKFAANTAVDVCFFVYTGEEEN